MARMGYCPSGRLFEAAACGTPIVSDEWEGLADFFEPGREIILARDTGDVVEALDFPASDLIRIAARARARALEEHSADRRIMQLEAMVGSTPNTTSRAGESGLAAEAISQLTSDDGESPLSTTVPLVHSGRGQSGEH